MKSQKTLKSFFKSDGPLKRALVQGSDYQSCELSKKQKLEDKNEVSSIASKESYEQLQHHVEENKFKAKIKLQSKKTPILATNIGISWFKALENEFSKDYFIKLSCFVEGERSKYTVYPPREEMYSWTHMCAINEVKVVILGQDPYHGDGQAHGLAFSVPPGKSIPPSLKNIYKEMSSEFSAFTIPKHGYLKGWALQGVLLLNASLTVRANSANSHQDHGWEHLSDAVIKWLDKNQANVVFLLWGAYAQKKIPFINKEKHLVLSCSHPSPLSASRGFFGCQHFSKTNEYLKKFGHKPIDWSYLPTD